MAKIALPQTETDKGKVLKKGKPTAAPAHFPYAHRTIAEVDGGAIRKSKFCARPSAGEHPIVIRAASLFHIPTYDLIGSCREAYLVEARQCAMMALRNAGYSLPQIAALVGRADHTTVLHGLRVAEGKVANDVGFRMAVKWAGEAA